MTTIRVETREPYDVVIGSGVLSRCGDAVASLGKDYDKIAVISDDNVFALYGGQLLASLQKAGYNVVEFVFPNGETSKSMENLQNILGFLCEGRCTRKSLVVALGGGVVGDIAGFAAAIYQRGIDYIQIPTTFLAAIDSSVGGKTAVNLPQGKNLAGAFWQPKLVLHDTDTLSTLSADIFRDGVAEAVKYGCIWDRALFDIMRENGFTSGLSDIIARCVAIKAEVVRLDERESGLRGILNFGHTLGHGIEKLSDYGISHGKAVAIGMVLAAKAGERAGLTADGTSDAIRGCLEREGIITACPYPIAEACAAAMGDKKRTGDTMNLILLNGIGKAFIHPVLLDDLAAFFDAD